MGFRKSRVTPVRVLRMQQQPQMKLLVVVSRIKGQRYKE